MNIEEKGNTVKCTLCGTVFDPDEKNTCGGCILNKECKLICCPNCGFRMPEESKLSEWLRKRFEKLRRS